MYVRPKNERKWIDAFIPFARKYLVEISSSLGGFSVLRSSDYKIEVVGPNIRCIIDIKERTCTCRCGKSLGCHIHMLHLSLILLGKLSGRISG